ncbi:autotransporter domain-containing protein [Oxalobacter aliiformigenes]|uniref:Autotransporter domain-containing protein n=1 Tax=Oxalobacter aliiformigenes TaxID=2946593 RepID=A0ABY7JII9_9BURK|nr:autotransporter domain-containing protein [Oxalobacter aliiformigenes]WAV93431.1 autotransporter domain-containing protein [Oxalobacter aliiformigenes]WAV95072.1 autotransporter domain-containing protein [Oxalobacter aliiformigenes]WAV97127.1 autotransporter domain-containing protein [Oxalobacter aliiformigenes]
MNRPLSKKPDRSGKRPSSLRRLFVPTLLCLALFPASFALAEKSGGQDNIPRPNDYGNTASLTGNNVRVTGETISGSVFGAYTTDNPAAVSGNNVTVTDSNIEKSVYGGYADVRKSEINPVSIDGFSEPGEENGKNVSAIANNNSVDVSGSETKETKVTGYIYGGRAYIRGAQTAAAEANNNSVDVFNSTAKGIYGGYAYIEGNGNQTAAAEASGNSVTVSGSTVDGDVVGGYAEVSLYEISISALNDESEGQYQNTSYSEDATAKANNNSVTVSNGSTTNGIYGGYASATGNQTVAAEANGNNVTVSDNSTAGSDIYGGMAMASGAQIATAKANGNSVTVSGSTVNGDIFGSDAEATGAQTATAEANNNSVTVTSNSTVEDDIYGGYAYTSGDQTAAAEANGNSVTVTSNSTVEDDIYGGRAYVEGNQTGAAEANGNSVTVTSNSTVEDDIYGGRASVYDSQTVTAGANGNSVTVSGNSTVKDDIYGGYAYASGNQTAAAEANGNSVTVSGNSTVEDDIYGGRAYVEGNQTGAAEANGNSVTVSGSTVNGDILGSDASATGDQTTTAEANNNNVTVSNGSTVNGNIFGGYADAYYGTQNTEYATGNTVTIDSATVESGNTIAGGAVWIDNNDDTHIATGNTVTLTGNYTIDGTSLYGGYDEGNEDFASGPNDDLFSGNTLNLDARKVATTSVRQVANFETINIRAGNINNGDTVLQTSGTILGNGKTGAEAKGTTVNLISIENPSLKAGDKLTLITDTEGTLANDKEKQFVQKGENFAVGYDAQIEKESGNVIASIEGNKLNPETKILNENRAASLAFINSGTDLLLDTDIGKGKNIFGAIRGGHSRYETGSSVEIDGVNLITGFAHTQTGENGDITGGAFIEAGWGDTATHNTLGGKRLKGNGNTHYYGAGILGRYEWTRGAVKGLYADAAVRAGKLSSDYHNNDATNIKGQRVSYDIDSTYYAAHLGIGYQWDMTNALRLDTSAQYMWAHVDSENTTILGERYHLDAMDSHRTRVGVKLNYTAEPQYTPYIGIAWEHEFDGKAKSSVEGYAIDEADLGGSSGIVTLGVDFKPSENSPLTLEAGVTGYVGQHEGVAGQFRMQYTF